MLKVLDIKVKVEFNPGIVIEPCTEIGPNDTVLGKVNPRQKELFVLAEQLGVVANNIFETSNGADANGMKKLLKAKAVEFLQKSEAIMTMFCIDVFDVYNLWGSYDKIDIGIRKGWWIVWTKAVEKEEDALYVEVLNN